MDAAGRSPPTNNRPDMSGNQFTRPANGHDSDVSSFSLPSATEKLESLVDPPDIATVAATIFPSGDQDGPVKNTGEKCCGDFLTARLRSPLPSMLAITSALSPGFG